LKSLGLLRRQVSSVTAWQVSTLAVLALRAGVPLGVAAGRQAGVLVVGTPGIHQAAPWPAWDRPGQAGGDKVR
jgi:predicted lysophospholipase L1 biosynthesis ABC-type transport system permease subunit